MSQTELLLNDRQWENHDIVDSFLADRLIDGNLLIFLGAGVSKFYGMPDWETLLKEIKNNDLGHTINKASMSFPAWAENIQNELFPKNRKGFNEAVSNSLYSKCFGDKFDIIKISENKTLRSIGALCQGSTRGTVAKVVTLNYDCLLEAYCQFCGITVQTIYTEHFIEKTADLQIYHPHGYLPHELFSKQKSQNIVLTRADYESAYKSLWQETLKHLLRTHFVLFIGLSGEDDRISQLAANARTENPFVLTTELPFYGLIMSLKGSPMKEQWKNRGIFCREVESLSDSIPELLFSICRHAAEKTK